MLASSAFDAHWMSVRERHSLPESCTARYVPDQTLLDYEEPVEDEVEEEPEDLEEREADDGVEDEMVVEVADDDESDAVETAVTTAEVISATTVPSTAPPTTVDGSRESSPDSSDISESSSSGDESERGWQLPPLALVPVKRKVAYCDRCQCKFPNVHSHWLLLMMLSQRTQHQYLPCQFRALDRRRLGISGY